MSAAAETSTPVAVVALDAPASTGTNYPPPFAERVAGRSRRRLGNLFGIEAFGVNLVTLAPGAQSSVRHRHSVQDEFVYLLSGELVLAHDGGETLLSAGMCAGFPHGGTAHHLINRSDAPAVYIEVGDRRPGDSAEYPDDDLCAVAVPGGWRFTRKNGEPYA
jgi:uncharacterized cupin superfamily protein